MPTYKLIYFKLKGRAEVTRFVFAQANIPYTDDRVDPKDWPALKESTPYGSMPILEIDDFRITGSIIIPRYLAELPEFNLAGSNAIENTQVAGVADFLHDLESAVVKVPYAKEEEKEAVTKNFIEKDVPKFFGKLESLSSSTGTSGFLWRNKLTWADFYFYELYEWIIPFAPTVLEKYPSLGKLVKNIEALPNIAKWLKERPVTAY